MSSGGVMGTTEPVAPEVDPLRGTRYRSKGILGRGAMGEVHLAEHTSLGKMVVAKLLHRELSGRPDLADRMRIEAQSLARLSHPSLVQVLDYGETPEGRPYLIMERLIGRSLRQEFQQRGAMPFPEAVEITIQMLAGLGAAHDVGLVHRDVKLDNIFICPQVRGAPVVKVIDFGIAKVLSTAKPGEAPAPLAFPTEDGMTVGTPRFLSPEQARGKPVDARADIYGAGVVLYTLVAGRGPFDHAQGLVELIRAQALEPPTAPSRYAPHGLPAALDMVILKALEKDPNRRFASAPAFIEALRWSLTAVVPDPPPPRPAALVAGGRLPDSQTYESQFMQVDVDPQAGRRALPHTPPIVPAAGRPASEPSPPPAPPEPAPRLPPAAPSGRSTPCACRTRPSRPRPWQRPRCHGRVRCNRRRIMRACRGPTPPDPGGRGTSAEGPHAAVGLRAERAERAGGDGGAGGCPRGPAGIGPPARGVRAARRVPSGPDRTLGPPAIAHPPAQAARPQPRRGGHRHRHPGHRAGSVDRHRGAGAEGHAMSVSAAGHGAAGGTRSRMRTASGSGRASAPGQRGGTGR
ncbi:MAG: serine/threonine-protein kinase [Polyangiaceae bacterium]